MKFDSSGLTRIGSVGRSGWVTSRYLTCQLLFRYCFLFVSLTLSGPKFIVTTSTSIKAFHSLSEKNAVMTGHAQLGIQILDGGKALGLSPANGLGFPPANDLDLHPDATAINTGAQDTQSDLQLRMSAITSYEQCNLVYEDLLAELTEIPNYHHTEDHTIFIGMKKKHHWIVQMRELRLDVVEAKNKMTANGISGHMPLIAALEINELLKATIKAIKTADEARGMYSERDTKSCPKKLPNYAGLEFEDFSII